MGKQQAQVGSNVTVGSLGLPDLSSNAVNREASAGEAQLYHDKLFKPNTNNLVQGRGINQQKSELDELLPNGANLFSSESDIEHQLGAKQPVGEQIGEAISRFAPMGAIKLAEMVTNLDAGIGYLIGTPNAIGRTKPFADYLEKVGTELKDALPIHSTEGYDTGNIGQHIFSSKFWTDDVSDGLTFILAQAIGTKGLGAAAGAVGKGASAIAEATNLSELYNAVPITQRIATATANKFTTGTVGFLNAAAISGMQARGTGNQIEAKMRESYGSQVNPDTGDYYTADEIDSKIAKAKTITDEKVSNTFWATMATELLPSIYASKMFLGGAKDKMGQFNTDIMKAVNVGKLSLEDISNGLGQEVLNKSGWQNIAREATKAATIGGVAMNLQTSIQKYDVDQAIAGYDGNAWNSSLGYARQFLDNFTNNEGLKGIVMGAVLGGLTGAFHAKTGASAYNEGMNAHLESMRASDALFGTIPKDIYKTDKDGKLILDKNNNPIEDTDKLTKLTFQMLHNKNNWDNQTAAILSANSDMATLNEHVALAQAIGKEIQSGRYDTTDGAWEYFKWFHKQRITEQSLKAQKDAQDNQVTDSVKDGTPQGDAAAIQTQTAMKTGSATGDAHLSKLVNDNAQMIDQMFTLWDKSGKQAAKLTRLGESSDKTAFNENTQRALYYEGVKREAMKKMLLDKEAEMKEVGADREGLNKQTEVLQNLITDSEKRTSDFLNKPDEIYNEWNNQRNLRADLYTKGKESSSKFKESKDDKDKRALETANYIWQEHSAKEGVNTSTLDADTDTFLNNQDISTKVATPISLRNEFQYKAGLDYVKMGRLNDLIDQVKSGDITLKEAVSYAADNITKMDEVTSKKLQDLIADQKSKVTEDEQKLATIPDFDEATFTPNPEYQELEQSIEERNKAIEDSTDILDKAGKTQELNMLDRQPDKIEETLNKQFAEKNFEKGNNVLANAVDENGAVKDTYTDSRSVNAAIDQVTRMRNAFEDRITDGDLKGQTQYQYLINKADTMLEKLIKVRNAVADNMLKRDGMQRNIADQHARANSTGVGFNLDTNSVSAQPVFNAADTILKGKLKEMLAQVKQLRTKNNDAGNYYEGTMAILHALKNKASAEDMANLTSLMDEHIDNLLGTFPTPKGMARYKADLPDSPELYFSDMLQSLFEPNKGFEQMSIDKGSPMGRFLASNDIDQLEADIAAMPEDTKDLGAPKQDILDAVKSYRDIVAIDRVKNLLNSKLDLSKTVGDEIKAATNSNGIVPTAQQEVSIRDGLAWLSSNKEVGTSKYNGWGFLRGIAGTGKTSVAVKWLLELSGLKPEEVLGTAATDRAAGVLGAATGSEAKNINDIMEEPLPANKKLIVIDEYARIPTDQLEMFEKKVREHNKGRSPADRVRVMILGDPTQITPLTFSNQDITRPGSNKSAKNIRVINPLTVVYRSDVSAVNEASDIFQANNKPVTTINVRADRDMNSPLAVGVHTSKSAQDIPDLVRTNKKYEADNGLTPRSRVIITEAPGKYAGLDVPAISVYDAQSETYDEVYVDLNPSDFSDTEKFNTAMYTAASRAKAYTYIRHDNGVNTTDPGLSREKENNDQTGREAKGEYIKQRTEEQTMMDAANKGKDINVPKTEMAVKVQAAETPLEKATEPNVPENAEIVTEIASSPSNQVLPPDIDPEGHVDPESEDETSTEPIQPEHFEEGEHFLPNIEKGTFEALGGRRQQQVIGKGSPVYHMYTKEANGENAITTFAFDPDGNWIPISKVFQDELNKMPRYAKWKAKTAGMQPMFSSDPQQLNAVGGRAAYPLSDMAKHQVDEGTITRTQRLTYVFDNRPVQNFVAERIKNVFKNKFFSSKPAEQAKADKIVFKIFRNNELQSHKFGGFTPEAGIPYAVVGAEANSRDWSKAQFVRLTANRLSNQSEHYQTLKSYRDSAKEIESTTGVSPGTTDYNLMVRALKNSLKIVHEDTPTGTEPKVRMRDDYSRKEFIENLKKVTDKNSEFTDPTEHLTDDQFEQILPKMQGLASMIYGIQETKAELTASELEKGHGTDYEHLPLKTKQVRTITNEDGTATEEPLGRARLKGTGPGTGKKDVYIPDWELNTKKGPAQQAFNQLAKANEFVGNVRIRTDEYKTGKDKIARSTTATGKSLITEKGGDAKIYSSRKVLGKILGETHVQEGKLDELDLEKKEVRTDLENQIRKMAGEQDMDARTLGAKLLSESNLDEDRKTQLANELNDALDKKETPPVTMKTLDLMVGDENYENGEHLTQEAYNVTNPKSGRTKETQTYLRTPLDIDQFNELGKAPEANADDLSKMVGTKFADILPTQIAVINRGEAASKPTVESTTEARAPSVAPGSGRELQDKIDNITTQLSTMKAGREKLELIKEQRRLIAERDNTSRLFDESIRREDKGLKITTEEATREVKRMLPAIKDNELVFLNKSMMIELQRPGESLLGLYNKGQLALLDDNGVYGNVVRHEVFHKVFNDYLTDRERSVISSEFDPQGRMTPVEMEEALADRFMTWKQQPETAIGKVRRIFQRIAEWLGFAQNNGNTVDKLFKDIENGKFRNPDPDTANTRMAFSDIRKWGTVQDYKDASRFLQQRIFRHFIDDHIENQPLTQSELFEALKKDLQDTFATEDASANDLVEGIDYLTGEYNAASSDSERQAIQADIDVYNNELIESNQKLQMLHTFTQDSNALRDMWKDLYPNFSFKKSGVVDLEDNPSKDDPESLERSEDEQDKEAGSIRSDFILNSDEKNQETKISQNVKNFLSFIYRPATTGRNAKGESRVNPRGVYLLALRNLSGMQTGDADFILQLNQRAKENNIHMDNKNDKSDAKLVIENLINLWHNAKGGAYIFNEGRNQKGEAIPKRVELPLHNRFLDENTFVSALDSSDISGITESGPNHLVITRDGRSTADFLKEVLSSNITEEQAKGYFKQFQAQETLREVMSNFTSQREATPMIAEEVNDYGKPQLRYFRAQSYGIERTQATELENGFKDNWDKAVLNGWKDFEKARPQDQNRAIADFLKHLGVDGESVRSSDSSLVSAVYGDLQAFRKVVQQTAADAKVTSNENASDSDESVTPVNPVTLALENNSGMLDRLNRLLTRNSSDERASSYTDVKGQKRYLFHNGSQAHDIIGKIIRHFVDKIGSLPKHLTEDTILSKNIFATGLNKITEVLDHDGSRQEGREEFATTYSDESNKQWLERNFSYGFLSFMKTNARDNADALTYMQNFYTISNRPRMVGARVEVMSEPKIKEAITKAIEQHVEQPDLKEVKNYDRFKAVNFDEMHRAIEKIHGVDFGKDTKTTEGRVKLANLYDRISTSPELKSELAEHIVGQLKEQANEAMQRMKSEQVKLSVDSHEAIKLLKDPRRQILPDEAAIPESSSDGWPLDEQMRPTVESFYMNNYVNSYFLNQTVTGNMNYFKSALDMVKRMSGVFAPGTKGIVGDKFFMKQKFNVAIAADPKMKAEYLSPIFKDTKLMEAVGKKAFDMADAQGFMLPERAANIVQGFGKNYNAGAVFKPAHYEIAERTLQDGTKAYVPVMLKYSSVVLSDDLVSRHPKLEALRQEMRDKNVHEFVFDSGTKVGAPSEQVNLPSVIAYDNNSITIDPKSVVELNNENYRLQLNPSADAFDKVSNPTQLGYFLNVMHKLSAAGTRNLANADAVYSAIGEKIQRGIAKLSETALDASGKFKTSIIKNSLTGAGNERLQEMLAAGLDYNMPNITDKALIQMANTVDKDTVKIKFPGGKMVLQSSYGMDIPDGKDGQRRLEYQQDEKGRWHAEVLLPKAYMDKANPGDFLLPDGMGFRIPSTELHSSVPFKVAGFYDDKGSNVVVAPAELVAQHGSDFDVDSLSVIVREQAKENIETANHEFTKGTPVGYYPVGDKLQFNPVRFRNELEEAKLEAAGDKKTLTQLEKLHDQMLTNQVTEAFLDTISHPDNKDRMLTPISTDVIDASFKELGITGEQKVNLSRLLDNLQVYNSNFQGASLVGTFANGMKSLSYISRAGSDGNYPELKVSTKDTAGLEVQWNGKTYDKFTEQDHGGGNLWEELDALVNTSVDNVKEQKLYLMNATDKTGAAYIAAKAIGMPLTEAMRMMLQPVIRQFSETQGGKKTAIDNLKKAIVAHAVDKEIISEGQNYSDLKATLKEYTPELTTKSLDARLSSNSLGETPEEVAHQMAVLEQFEKINKIGADLSTFSSAIGILQAMPVFYEDISRKVDQWNEIGTITDGKLQTSSDFSFNLDNLLQAQPNIAEAYKAFSFMKQAADTSLIKHFPEVKALADEMAGSMKIRLLADDNANREKLKNEISSYLLSTYYSDSLRDQKPIEVDRKKGGQSILTGKQAWSQEFSEQIEKAIKEDGKTNPFLKRLSVKKDNYGVKTIQFANSSNPDAEEALEMQEGFSAIKDQNIKDGLLKYGVLNFGLNFGARNYSMFIPSELLKPISDFITKDVKGMVQKSTLDADGQLIAGPLKNIRDNLAIKLAVNNPDKLPFISPKKIPAIQSVDEAGKPRTINIGDQTVNVLSGYDSSYFWHRAYENPRAENGSSKYDEKDLPEFIKQRDGNSRDVVYRRLNAATEEKVFYQRVGYKNYSGGYDGKSEIVRDGYNPDDYFAKGTIPVPVADVRTGEYEARNEYIKEGSRVVVYPYSNATREEGISGIVDKVRTSLDGSDKVTFTLRQEDNANQEVHTQRMFDVAQNVASKFGLHVISSDGLPEGVKGKVEGDIVYLNPKLMTPDTIFHEVSHPLIAAIQKQNPVWYQNLTTELNGSVEGRSILRKVQAKYPELSKKGQETEALVTAIGQEAANKLPESNFRTLVRRLMRSIGNTVRSVINEIRGKGGLSLESLAAEEMAKLSIGDIAEILAAGDSKFKLDLSKVQDEPQFSKDLGDEKPEKDSVMEAILARAATITDPVKGENGQEGDTYSLEGSDLLRVSKAMDNFTFRDKKEMISPDGKPLSTIDAIAKRDADRMFKTTAPGGKLIIDGIEQTKQEYEDSKRKIQAQGIAKGNIIHAKIQRFLAVLQGDTPKVSELDNRIEELSSQADKLPSAYDWVTRKGIFDKIMQNAGINIGSKVVKGQEDKIFSEVKVGSSVMGIAGKVDMLIERPDGRLRIADWKTGSKLKDKYSASILKYGVQENRITDNPLDRAKLQVMLYAMTIKAEHPTTKFDGLVVMHLPNEFEATQGRNALPVEIPDYLNMLQQYYRNEEPAKYKAMLEASPRIFDPREYNAPLHPDFAQDVLNSGGMTEAEQHQKYMLDLQKLEVSINEQRKNGYPITKEQMDIRAKLVKKIQQATDYNGTDFTGALDPQYEIGVLKRWMGTLDDVHNPYVQNLAAHLRTNEERAAKELAANYQEFDNLLRPVIKERLGADRTVLKKALTSVDYAKVFNNFYTETRTKDDATGAEYVKRGATLEGSDAWKRMTPAEQALSVFIRKNMHDVYHEVMVNGPLAVVGEKANGDKMTKQDLYNSSRRGASFKYEADFMPRLAISREEVNSRLWQGKIAPKDWVQDTWLRATSDFFDNNAEGYNQKDYGLPVRYLGNAATYASPDTYSLNIEDGYKKFMEQMIRKKHLDSTWMYGQAVKGILESARDANGNEAFKQTAGFIDQHLKNILLGDSINKGTKLARGRFGFGQKDGKEYTVSLLKTYRTMKGGFAAATLWAQPTRAFVNAAQATYMLSKEAGVNSLLGKFGGLKSEEQDLSFSEHNKSYIQAMSGLAAAAAGKGKSSFEHNLAKELRLYGDMDEEGGKHNEYLTKGCTLLDTSNFGLLYKIPEEATNVQYALNFLKNMKIQSGKYEGKTMYDMYKNSFNSKTGTFDMPEDFKRGVIEKGDGTFEQLAGLHALEINKIHRGIAKIKGGYRKDERTAIQSTILGDAFMMFKRWIPALAIQQYQGKYADPSLGQFELNKDRLSQKPGEDVYQWRARVVEGRFHTVWGQMMRLAGMNKYSGYAWSDLSGEQRKASVDAVVSLITFASMAGAASYAYAGRKEDDSLRVLTSRIMGQFIQQWSLPEMVKAAIQPPSVLKRTNDSIDALFAVTTAGYHAAVGDDKSTVYTERGDIRGMNQLMKNVPLLSSYYEINKFVDNTDTNSTWGAVSPF